jgi:hypothetical protein
MFVKIVGCGRTENQVGQKVKFAKDVDECNRICMIVSRLEKEQ